MNDTTTRYVIQFARFDLDDAHWPWFTYLKEDYETEEQARTEIAKITSHEWVFRIQQIVTTTTVIEYLPTQGTKEN